MHDCKCLCLSSSSTSQCVVLMTQCQQMCTNAGAVPTRPSPRQTPLAPWKIGVAVAGSLLGLLLIALFVVLWWRLRIRNKHTRVGLASCRQQHVVVMCMLCCSVLGEIVCHLLLCLHPHFMPAQSSMRFLLKAPISSSPISGVKLARHNE